MSSSSLLSKSTMVQVLLGVLAADFMVGLFHWLEDTYIPYDHDMPEYLKQIALDNEMHHYFPRGITAFSYWEHMEVTLPLTLVLILAVYVVAPDHVKGNIPFYLTLGIISAASNIIHRYTHERDHERHPFITSMYNMGILCSREQHQIHHQVGNVKYCLITPYLNHVLDTINFWRSLEDIISGVTGIKPVPKMPYNAYAEIHTQHHKDAAMEVPPRVSKEDIAELTKKLSSWLESI